MIHRFLKTDIHNPAYLFIRVTLAAVILPHGAQKLWGAFGGYGFEGTIQYFTETVGVPWFIGFLVIIAEALGTVLLAVGLLSRLIAGSLAVIMAGAAAQHIGNGFFMNWFGNQAGEGIEFFILAIAMAMVIVTKGAGKWSIDGWLTTTRHQKNISPLAEKFETSL